MSRQWIPRVLVCRVLVAFAVTQLIVALTAAYVASAMPGSQPQVADVGGLAVFLMLGALAGAWWLGAFEDWFE